MPTHWGDVSSTTATRHGLEVDFVVEFPDGTWAALEAKLGEKAVASAEANLLKLKSIVNTGPGRGTVVPRRGSTGAEFGYTRDSGGPRRAAGGDAGRVRRRDRTRVNA